MKFLRVKNFEQFQHYKDRSPPWIKLHNSVLDDYEFGCLQDASKLHLILIWLLASRLDNRIPADPEWVAKRINATDPVDLNSLIKHGFLVMEQDASKPLAECLQDACLETETETEGEREAKRVNGRGKKTPTLEEVRAYAAERSSPVDPETFHDWNTAKGWKVGKEPMKDWRAAFRTWEKRQRKDVQEDSSWLPS